LVDFDRLIGRSTLRISSLPCARTVMLSVSAFSGTSTMLSRSPARSLVHRLELSLTLSASISRSAPQWLIATTLTAFWHPPAVSSRRLATHLTSSCGEVAPRP
jgi:hypothetical protein